MLYLENEEVKITNEGMTLSEVKELYNTDKRNENKPFFYKCLTFIYWGYKKDGIWANLPPKERLRKAAEKAELDYDTITTNKKVLAVAKEYVKLTTTLNERLYLGVKKDSEEVLEILEGIPFKKRILVEVMVDIPESKDSKIMIKYPVKQWVEIDNIDEKKKAMKSVEDIINLEESLRKRIIKEYQQKRITTGRLFDERSENA